MRIGIFGGTFDPIHYGHLRLAETCREDCEMDEVWFMPAAVAPHKQQQDFAPKKSRLEMLQLAIAGHDTFRISAIELDRGGVSYTVDTLTEVKKQIDAELYFLMGADSLCDLPSWREPRRICELAIPLVVRRTGSPDPDYSVLSEFVSRQRLDEIRSCQVDMPLLEISSTNIRCRVANGQSIRYLTPRAVEKYIETNGLYREASRRP